MRSGRGCKALAGLGAVGGKGARPFWLGIPAGVVVVGEVSADFDDGEHAAHADGAEWAIAAHHGDGVFGAGHVHGFHFAHAFGAHRHVGVGGEGVYFLGEAGLIDADHVGDVVTHGVHGVVGFVAVESPIAGVVGDELNVAGGSDGDVDGVFRPARGGGDGSAVGAGDLEHVTVEVDGVVVHGEIAEADADAVALFDDHGIDAGEDAGVEGEEVEVGHDGGVGGGGSGGDGPFHEHDGKIAIDDLIGGGVLGMDDEEAHHAEGHLDHFVEVGVVHEGALLIAGKFIDDGFAGLDGGLSEAGDAVHAVGEAHAVPVDGGGFGEFVGDVDAEAITFGDFDGGAWGLAVVAPAVDDHAGGEFFFDGFGGEAEGFAAILHGEGQRGAVEGDDGRGGGWRRRWCIGSWGIGARGEAEALEERGAGGDDGGGGEHHFASGHHGLSPMEGWVVGEMGGGSWPPTARSSWARAIQ